MTNAGGPGVLATDRQIGSGAQLAELTPETMASLRQILPPAWNHSNPVDIIGDAGDGGLPKGTERAHPRNGEIETEK